MTVDGFAYHSHHPHHHPHPHPHQSPVHQQESSFFSIFLLPFSFFLCFTFFHLGELGQPNHVQFRVTVTVMTVIFYFFCILPSRCPGQRQNKKASRAEKKKVKFRPISRCHHPSHIHGWECQQREKKILRARLWLISGWVVELVLFILFSMHILFCIFDGLLQRKAKGERERDKEGAGINLPPSRECTGTSIQYLQEA